MLSVARCRDLLANEADSWSDAQVETLRDHLYALAGLALERLEGPESAKPRSLPNGLEERALIPERDSGPDR